MNKDFKECLDKKKLVKFPGIPYISRIRSSDSRKKDYIVYSFSILIISPSFPIFS